MFQLQRPTSDLQPPISFCYFKYYTKGGDNMLNTQALTLETIIVQGKDNIVSDMDGEKVILSIQNGKYYNLGNIGGAIWDLINAPISVMN